MDMALKGAVEEHLVATRSRLEVAVPGLGALAGLLAGLLADRPAELPAELPAGVLAEVLAGLLAELLAGVESSHPPLF